MSPTQHSRTQSKEKLFLINSSFLIVLRNRFLLPVMTQSALERCIFYEELIFK